MDRVEELEKARDWLRQQVAGLKEDRSELQHYVEELEEALRKIRQWSEAYPLDIFPEPDWTWVRAILAGGGVTVDAVSASVSRRLIEGVGRIAREALGEPPK